MTSLEQYIKYGVKLSKEFLDKVIETFDGHITAFIDWKKGKYFITKDASHEIKKKIEDYKKGDYNPFEEEVRQVSETTSVHQRQKHLPKMWTEG